MASNMDDAMKKLLDTIFQMMKTQQPTITETLGPAMLKDREVDARARIQDLRSSAGSDLAITPWRQNQAQAEPKAKQTEHKNADRTGRGQACTEALAGPLGDRHLHGAVRALPRGVALVRRMASTSQARMQCCSSAMPS